MNDIAIVFSLLLSQISKEDFIILIKNSNLHKDFEYVDTQSDYYWKKKADLAFRFVNNSV